MKKLNSNLVTQLDSNLAEQANVEAILYVSMKMRYRRIYRLLTNFGFSPLKAVEIMYAASCSSAMALECIRIARNAAK